MRRAELYEWAKSHGKLYILPHDPKGDYARVYMNDLLLLIEDQIRKAENRAKRKRVK